ncbi:MAG: hypothetical protein ACRDOE_19370 [Streptosporangiaceae bacterium]
MTAGGYFGRALVVDAGAGTSDVRPLPDELLRAYIGGAGLGAWLPGPRPACRRAAGSARPAPHRRGARTRGGGTERRQSEPGTPPGSGGSGGRGSV